MLFNSIDFAIFLPIVFLLYWFVAQKNLRLQNFLILSSSYLFYGWWDWRFLTLILFSTITDYIVGRSLSKEEDKKKRKALLWTSILINIGLLGFFKYYNFFVENFVHAFSLFGSEIQANTLNIILPVGISFYTFQTLSYTIDVYNEKLKPTKDLIAFASYVSFFPQLVAGPIERAKNLLPQFYIKRNFNYAEAVNGMRQILWGLFKKLVIADNVAVYVNLIFDNSGDYSGSTLVLGAVFFAFQIYCDFSGYSDIAIGTSRLFGFNLKENFKFPYFSRDIAEFWRRWHVSLSTWFRDYLYIPLGGSRGGNWMKVRNIFIIFLVSGFWHGANWTYIVWGAVNAFYILPAILLNRNRKNMNTVAQGRYFPSIKETFLMLITFLATVFAWIFFRAENIEHAGNYIAGIFTKSFFSIPVLGKMYPLTSIFILLFLFMGIEWLGREQTFAIQKISKIRSRFLRWSFYVVLILTIFYKGNFEENVFIYFQH